jgi:hypothetical protein
MMFFIPYAAWIMADEMGMIKTENIGYHRENISSLSQITSINFGNCLDFMGFVPHLTENNYFSQRSL